MSLICQHLMLACRVLSKYRVQDAPERNMALTMTFAEVELICDYRSVERAERAPIIRRYAEMTRLSLGRAEDALDLLSHLLDQHRRP